MQPRSNKRQKELARAEKRREKELKKAERKREKAERPPWKPGDPDPSIEVIPPEAPAPDPQPAAEPAAAEPPAQAPSAP